jgi:hypothetical protein
MITWGFVATFSDLITVDKPITTTVNGKVISLTATFIIVTGNAGDIVWINALGIPQYLPGAQANQSYTIGASKIVSSAVVNGTMRTTAATGLVYFASPSAA